MDSALYIKAKKANKLSASKRVGSLQRKQIMNKNLLFEYLVFRLDEWKKNIEKRNEKVPAFTKLRLQKILFLVCAWNVENTNRKLLNIFNQFYALPYGPVEIDIYEAMKNNQTFQHISFNGNECIYCKLESAMFASISSVHRKWIDEAMDDFVKNDRKYLTMPVFDLVDITHRWSAWRITMDIASFFGKKIEKMSVKSICCSSIKAF